MARTSPVDFLAGQARVMNPASCRSAGRLAWLLASAAGRPWRPLGWMFVTVLLIVILPGTSRAQYLTPAYPALFAGGAVAYEQWRGARWAVPLQAAVTVSVGVVLLPLAVPVLPVERYISYARALGMAPRTEERKAGDPAAA